MSLSPAHVRQFYQEGFTIFENALTPTELESLRTECDILVNHIYNEKDLLFDAGCIVEPLSCGYVDHDLSHPEAYKHDQAFYRRIRSQINDEVLEITLHKIAAMAEQVLPIGPDRRLYLLNEQYIVKPPRSGTKARFQWHQDSEYMPLACRRVPTVACWIALDDVSEANGTLLIDPYPSPSANKVSTSSLDHHAQFSSFYSPTPSSTPFAATILAGSVVLMSSVLRHCSTGNDSGRFRRAFMPQYSAGVVWSDRVMRERGEPGIEQPVKDSRELLAMAVPCGG
ncbi:hypothetical protein BC936DRAFT_145039, partial [Jimgerdemannia flammicorona]